MQDPEGLGNPRRGATGQNPPGTETHCERDLWCLLEQVMASSSVVLFYLDLLRSLDPGVAQAEVFLCCPALASQPGTLKHPQAELY